VAGSSVQLGLQSYIHILPITITITVIIMAPDMAHRMDIEIVILAIQADDADIIDPIQMGFLPHRAL